MNTKEQKLILCKFLWLMRTQKIINWNIRFFPLKKYVDDGN